MALSNLITSVESYLDRMQLPSQPSEDGVYFFRYGSTAVAVTVFADEAETFVRFSATTLSDFTTSFELLQEMLRLNNEVLFGAFLLYGDNTICFTATLLGNHLDFEEFQTALLYVARTSDDWDDHLQAIGGGHRAQDLLEEMG